MKSHEKFVGEFGDGFVMAEVSCAVVGVHAAQASKKSGAVAPPERRRETGTILEGPSVTKKAPPSRFQTVRLGTLGAFFLGFSGWLMRSSMRDCGGGHASAL